MDKKKLLLFSRFSLFLVYFWFGFLKIINISPADPVVDALLAKTLSFIPEDTFHLLLGLFEVGLAFLFLSGRFKKVTLVLFLSHMFATFLPLLLLPGEAWSGFLVPTFAGQYILKNVVLIALYLNIYKQD